MVTLDVGCVLPIVFAFQFLLVAIFSEVHYQRLLVRLLIVTVIGFLVVVMKLL